MRRIIYYFGVIGLLIIGVLFLDTDPSLAHSETVIIKMTDDSFNPQDITIHVGAIIIFKNMGKDDHWPASNIHPTHEIYPEFDPHRPIPPGEDWVFTFDKAGTWKLHDHLYPNIAGTITVVSEDNSANSPEKSKQTFTQRLTAPIKHLYDKIYLYLKKMIAGDELKNISKDSKEIFSNQKILEDYIKKYGPKETIKQLNALSSEFGSCHDVAHVTGRLSYQLTGEDAFKECSAECHSGCYHGATEAYFKEHGTDNLSKNLNVLCGNELNAFFSHQCIHGIGHGLMAWASYDIFEALKSCDLLSSRQDSCWTGVFMENIVGGLTDKNATGHFTKYLSDDPQYPCNIVEDKYKPSCYFLQTSRMVQLLANDFSKISDACLEAPVAYQYSCFLSMGRDVGGSNRKNPKGAIESCSKAPAGQYREACLSGSIQDTFWDPSGQDDALEFCKLLDDPKEKDMCYSIIFGRAREVINSKDEMRSFCSKAEAEYQKNCYES
ncbi:MAG: cupredoxin domain-containing protein [bacterium]|nr:cupredoxin domain-containing protein [bacterium]